MNEPIVYVTYCPDCEGRTQFVERYRGLEDRDTYLTPVAIECFVCRTLLAGHVSDDDLEIPTPTSVLKGKKFPDVPAKIAGAASEAHRSEQAGCLRGAVILARAAIEATAKDQGITAGNVAVKIRQMFEQQLIRESVREGADEVRHFGNDMAHGDFPDPVDPEDVRLALELMDEVLQEVYQGPARVRKARERRAAAAG